MNTASKQVLGFSEAPQQQRTIGEYIITQQIGSGSFSVVWKGRHKLTGAEVAIKEIPTAKLNKKLIESFDSEIDILQRANHPNIIQYIDLVRQPDRLFVILEFCAGGDLSDFIKKHGKVAESVARHFMRQLGAGLQVLRSNNLIHRDLKPQNLLLSTTDRGAVLKIADFGFARSLQPQGMAETLCGSPLYMAPEILQYQKYDAKADMWSVGAILFELVCGRPPFGGENPPQLLKNIERSEARIPESVATNLSDSCINLCRLLLRKNPVERLSFEEFFHHPFLENPRSPSGPPPPMVTPRSKSFGSSGAKQVAPGGLTTARIGPRTIAPASREGVAAALALSSRFAGEWAARTENHPAPKFPPPVAPRSPDYAEVRNKDRSLGRVDSPPPAAASSDSMECIERDYVVVHAPGLRTSSDTFSPPSSNVTRLSPPAQGISGTTARASGPAVAQNSSGNTNRTGQRLQGAGVVHSGPTGLEDTGDVDDIDRPSKNPAVRLSSLQRCARLATELAVDKLDAGQLLESLAIQLVCVAVWREALGVCHNWAAAAADGDGPSSHIGTLNDETEEEAQNSDGAAAAACALVEREFLVAVERTDEVGRGLRPEDGGVEMPDAIELIFQAALAVGRAGAVEELMGNVSNAAVAYAKANALFYFLLVEAPSLAISPPLVLTAADRQRLHRYADAVNVRQQHCSAARLAASQQHVQQQSRPGGYRASR
eukprot:TRINITY_DN9779_c0_g1_i1.p1 TRINITY_DN9779_c0_g1~~TRINITY_DN9779_c0_g1_i1.p1  ORF type:complete len:715 (+),score=145.64 TRINITY_DN9779_c0_g1_i1:73-2217(+)